VTPPRGVRPAPPRATSPVNPSGRAARFIPSLVSAAREPPAQAFAQSAPFPVARAGVNPASVVNADLTRLCAACGAVGERAGGKGGGEGRAREVGGGGEKREARGPLPVGFLGAEGTDPAATGRRVPASPWLALTARA